MVAKIINYNNVYKENFNQVWVSVQMQIGLCPVVRLNGVMWRVTVVQTVVRRHDLLVAVEIDLLFLSETSSTRARVLFFKQELLEQITVHLSLRLNDLVWWLLCHVPYRFIVGCLTIIRHIQVLKQELSPVLFTLHKIERCKLSSFLYLLLLCGILLRRLTIRLRIINLWLLNNKTSFQRDCFKRYHSNLF